MLRSAISRQSRLCRLALSGSPIRVATQATSHPFSQLSVSRASGSFVTSSELLRHCSRLYSSSAAAAEQTTSGDSDTSAPEHLTRFDDLRSLGVSEKIVGAITRDMGYQTMTDVQSLAIRPALEERDIVAQAKTGTGKTLAFIIPVLQRMLNEDPQLATRGLKQPRANDIRAVILSPTRELAEQIGVEARKVAAHTGLVVQTAVGGTQKGMMLQKTRREGCHLLVATPGRLNDLLSDQHSGIAAPRLNTLVLDEADRMLDAGFADELREILRNLPHPSDQPRQTLLFSATIPREVVDLAKSYVDVNNFKFVQTVDPNEAPTHERVTQYIVPCRGLENLFPTLHELIQQGLEKSREADAKPFKALVFFPTTASVEYASEVFGRIARDNRMMPRILSIHSKLTQGRRTAASDYFRRSDSAILFSSDVTARGMDFPNVTHVFQICGPPDRDQYIHRIGRTGRAGKEGQSWLLVPQVEVPLVRRRLPDLPIKVRKDVEAANVDLSDEASAEANSHVQIISRANKKVDAETLRSTYTSLIGGAMKSVDRQELVNALADWAKYGWGMDQPPAISAKLAQTTNISRCRNVNISSREMGRDDQSPNRFDRAFGRSSGSNNPFTDFGSDERSSNRFGGRYGSFQRSERGRGGGHSRDRRRGGSYGSRDRFDDDEF